MMVTGFSAGAIFIAGLGCWARSVAETRRIRAMVKLPFISVAPKLVNAGCQGPWCTQSVLARICLRKKRRESNHRNVFAEKCPSGLVVWFRVLFRADKSHPRNHTKPHEQNQVRLVEFVDR